MSRQHNSGLSRLQGEGDFGDHCAEKNQTEGIHTAGGGLPRGDERLGIGSLKSGF